MIYLKMSISSNQGISVLFCHKRSILLNFVFMGLVVQRIICFSSLYESSSTFLAHLYECTGRPIALYLALLAVLVFSKLLKLLGLHFLCDGQGTVR